MTLYVTQEDLNSAESCLNSGARCNNCPIAKALERTFGMKFWAHYCRIQPDNKHLDETYRLIPPDGMSSFMKHWDENRCSVLPSSFEIPDEIAARWTVFGQTGKVA